MANAKRPVCFAFAPITAGGEFLKDKKAVEEFFGPVAQVLEANDPKPSYLDYNDFPGILCKGTEGEPGDDQEICSQCSKPLADW